MLIKNMFKVLFIDIVGGRLTRLHYLAYLLLLSLLSIGFGLAVVLAIGVSEHIVGGNLQQAQEQLREWFSLPFLIIFGLISTLFVFSGFNIMAKRIRDIGLLGWWVTLAIIALEIIASLLFSRQAGSGLHALVLMALLLTPTDAMARYS